jgi:hypothetical protein
VDSDKKGLRQREFRLGATARIRRRAREVLTSLCDYNMQFSIDFKMQIILEARQPRL